MKLGRILRGILALLILGLGVSYLLAPAQVVVYLETEIDDPAEEVWQILAHQFGDIADWSSYLSESRLTFDDVPAGAIASPDVAPARETSVGPGVRVIEVITQYSEVNRELTFEGVDLPPAVFAFARDTQRTPKSEDKRLLSFDVDIKTKGTFKVNPLLKRRFTSILGYIQQDLKNFAESGRVANF